MAQSVGQDMGYQKPIGNKNKGNGSKKQPTIPVPTNGMVKQPQGGDIYKQGQQTVPMWKQPVHQNSDYQKSMPKGGYWQPPQQPQIQERDPFNEDLYNALQAFGMLGAVSDSNFEPARPPIDSRFPGDVTIEDILAYLPDNYAWLQPEETSQMTPGTQDPNGGGGGGYGGYGGSYIPMPDYSTWGGGGYGNNNGYRDSGLVNWRI